MTAATQTHTPSRGLPVYWMWIGFLVLLILVGVASGAMVFLKGLQVTNLTDAVPWGLWITIDLTAIALGAGAFSLSAIAYVLRVENYKKISRMAVFVGLVGYTVAMLALLMDIGRPDRFWHPTIYWNIHSVLWEITMCVILYSTVLIIEFLPIVLESQVVSQRFPRAPLWGHRLHSLTPVVAVVGLGLSLLHQSSLGATYGVLVARPVWFKPSLPIMFIVSAVAAGSMVTLAVTVFYESLIQKRVIPTRLRNSIAVFAALTMLAYLYLKLWDHLATTYYSHLPARINDLKLLERTTPYSSSFWLVEVLLGTLAPAMILLLPRLRRYDLWVMLAAGLAIFGTLVNRWNVTLSGLIVPLDWSPGVAEIFAVNAYRPSMIEWGVVVGLVGYALMMLSLGLRYFPLFAHHD